MLSPGRVENGHIRSRSSSEASHSKQRANDQDDLRDKYPEDNYSEEMGPNARVWKVYLDKCEAEDSRMLGSWKDTVDVLLVFAGLFSAVVTTLVVQASQSLQQDYNKVTAHLVEELIAVQRAAASSEPVIDVPASSLSTRTTFTADGLTRWVNGLWFISLALSLSVALLSVLIKQWIQNYSVPSSGTLQDRVKLRHYRYLGMQIWYVPAIVHLLPILLHVSLLIFFAGLVIFLTPLNVALSWIVSVIGVVSYFVYFITPWFPLWKPQCPYKSPLTQVAGEVSKLLSAGLCFLIEKFAALCERIALKSEAAIRVIQGVEEKLHRLRRFILENPRISVRALEEMDIGKSGTELTIQALESLHVSLSNPDIRTIALEAYAGLDVQINDTLLQRLLENQTLLEDLQEAFLSCFHFENRREAHLMKGQEGKAERLARAFLRLQLGVPKTYDYRYASCWDYLHLRSEEPTAVPLALLAKSSGFVYQEDYSFLTQEVDDQSFIDICLRGKLKLSVWVWVQLEEQVIQRNLRDCFDEGDRVGLLQTMKDLINALPSDYENHQSRYTVLVLHSLGCDKPKCPEVHPECRNTRRLLIHALVGILKQCDHETLLAFVQHLFKMIITELAWYNGVNSTEDSSSSSGISDGASDTTHERDREEDQTQVCLNLLREFQEVLLDHLTALFDERLQEDLFLRTLAVDEEAEVLIVPEFCFELHHRIRTHSWNKDLMMKAMYCLAIGCDPTNSMSLFFKDCFESEGSSRAVQVFRDFHGFDALWHHACSKKKDSVRQKAASSILFSYYVAAARAPQNLADSVFDEDFDQLKNTDIFIIVVEKIFAELQRTWDQHLEMPNLVANFKNILNDYEKFGDHDVWQKILHAIAIQNRRAPPSYDGGGDPLISTFGAIEELKAKVNAQETRFDLYFRPGYEAGPTGIMASLHPLLLFERTREWLDLSERAPVPVEPLKFDPNHKTLTIESPQRNGGRLSLSPQVSRDVPRLSMESASESHLQPAQRTLALAAYQRWRGFVGIRRAANPPSEPV